MRKTIEFQLHDLKLLTIRYLKCEGQLTLDMSKFRPNPDGVPENREGFMPEACGVCKRPYGAAEVALLNNFQRAYWELQQVPYSICVMKTTGTIEESENVPWPSERGRVSQATLGMFEEISAPIEATSPANEKTESKKR